MSTGCWGFISLVTKLTREVDRLGSTVARLKLKGIDGDPHKRWSMWFNSKQREEPYQVLTSLWPSRNGGFPSGQRRQVVHGCRQLVSWDVGLSPATSATLVHGCHHLVGHSMETAGVKPEEGGDDVKSSWPLCPGLHTCYNGRYKEQRSRESKQISKSRPQFGLESATRLHEAGIASNRRSAMLRWIRSRVLYSPPVTPWELISLEAGMLN